MFGKNKFLKLFFSGAICSFAFAPFYLFFLFFFSFYLLLNEIFNKFDNNKQLFLVGFIWGYGYFLGSFYWVINPLFFDFPRYVIFIPIALLFIPAFLACYIGVLFLSLYKIKEKFLIHNKLLLSIIFSMFWTIFELCKSYLFFPFPFNLIAYSLAFSPFLIQTVSIFGSYIFCFFICFVYCGLFIFKKNNENIVNYTIYYLIILFIIIFGFVKYLEEKKDNKNLNLNIRIIQPNFDEYTKNNPEKIDYVIDEILKNIKKDSEKIDLFFLPESGLPFIIFDNENDYLNKFEKNIISGILSLKNRQLFNSIVLIDNKKIIDYYDKFYLVPFGEYLPLRKFLPNFFKSFVGFDFSKGNKNKNFINFKNIIISPIICYESLFKNSINEDSDLIVNLTNDIWIGKTSGSFQHFDALKFRAIENRIPAIRVANSGISGYINKYGRIIKKTKINKKVVLDLKI